MPIWKQLIAPLSETQLCSPSFEEGWSIKDILAHIADWERLCTEWLEDFLRRSLQALASTAPVLYQSGNYQKVHRRSACLKPLRNVLYLFAWQSTRSEPWALEYYHHKRAEGKSHSVAVRALSNLWLRILYAMWITRGTYERTIFEEARQQHAPRAA